MGFDVSKHNDVTSPPVITPSATHQSLYTQRYLGRRHVTYAPPHVRWHAPQPTRALPRTSAHTCARIDALLARDLAGACIRCRARDGLRLGAFHLLDLLCFHLAGLFLHGEDMLAVALAPGVREHECHAEVFVIRVGIVECGKDGVVRVEVERRVVQRGP